jgi:hypothetical protein
LVISFSAGNGIQEFKIKPQNSKSAFRSPRQAPPDGYIQEVRVRKVRKPGLPLSEWIDDVKNQKDYFLRIRTVLDENGRVKTALYGKLYRAFAFAGAGKGSYFVIGAYYVNPEPNSRNMEFDPGQNLFKKLKRSEQVDKP